MTQVQFRKYAAEGNLEMVKKGLKQKSIDPSKADRLRETALDKVINAPGFTTTHTNEQLETIKLLLKAGVKPSHHSYSTLSLYGHLNALKILYKFNNVRIQRSELSSCVNNGHIETVKFILENNMDDVLTNWDLVTILVNQTNKWTETEMFKTIFDYVDDASIEDNKFMLKIVDGTDNKDIKQIIIADKKVISKAIELGQEKLFPQAAKDIFLF